jgi:hypothetical protein
LVEKKPWPKDWSEWRIIGSADFVKEPRTTIKVLETRFVEPFANERNLVAGIGRGED